MTLWNMFSNIREYIDVDWLLLYCCTKWWKKRMSSGIQILSSNWVSPWGKALFPVVAGMKLLKIKHVILPLAELQYKLNYQPCKVSTVKVSALIREEWILWIGIGMYKETWWSWDFEPLNLDESAGGWGLFSSRKTGSLRPQWEGSRRHTSTKTVRNKFLWGESQHPLRALWSLVVVQT